FNNGYEVSISKSTSDFYVIEITPTGTNATSTEAALTNFPELSYVPQPTGVKYDKKVVSGNTIMYEYSVLNVPLDFMNTYKNELSKNGWGICSTTYVDADFKIPYYSYFNNGYEVSISKSTSDFYVIEITPTGTNATSTEVVLTKCDI
ncbi:MAG: outer membrane lipoprotein-sorting protein, partial [Clostridium sp.]